MKTTFTLVLALSIQAMVNGQNTGSHTHRILADLCPKTGEASAETSCAPTRAVTSSKLNDVEEKLNEEIRDTRLKLLQKQVAMSRIRSYMAYEAFASNNGLIADLSTNPSLKETSLEKGLALNRLAAQEIKLAREIREEADAQQTPEAQLAELSNAEEKEAFALGKQAEAIRLLKLGAPLFMPSAGAEWMAKTKTEASPVAEQGKATDFSSPIQNALAIKTTSELLRAGAARTKGNEKAAMLNEAQVMEQDYLGERIRISDIQYRHTEQHYLENKAFIALLLQGIGDESLCGQAKRLSEEADYYFRLGKEMREEARAQGTLAARFGELTNAEEKEWLALSQQQQSIRELKKINRECLLACN